MEEVQTSLARLTPDGNFFADNARLSATLVARPGRAGVALGERMHIWELAWAVSLVDSQGVEARRFERRRRIDLPGEPTGSAKTEVEVLWDGRGSDGKPVRPGTYSVRWSATLQAVNVRTGRARPFARAVGSGGTIEIATEWDNREAAWVQLRVLQGQIGEKPTFADWDSSVAYELASPANLDALAALAVQAQGRNLAAEFAAALAEVRGDPEIAVKPTPAQVAAWQGLFLGSHGRVQIRWAASGVPREIVGLDAGLTIGGPETVASQFLATFAAQLGALYRRGPLDEMVLERVVERDGDPMAVVRYRHRVSGQADKTPFEVPGDVLAVQVRTAGMPGKSGRVEAVTARWNPLQRAPGPVLPDTVLAAAAKAASDLDASEPARLGTPWVAFPRPAEQRLLLDAFVADYSADEARIMRIDAETGEVVGVRDGYPKGRVTIPVGPASPDDGLYEHEHCRIGLPYADVQHSPLGGGHTTTTAEGYYELAGDWGRVGLDGRYAKELVLQEIPGDADDTCDGFAYREPLTARLALGDDTPIPIAHNRAGRQTTGDQDFTMATLYAHTNYQAELWRRSGLHDQGPVYLFVDWAPMGHNHPCTVDTDCDGCDATAGVCRSSEFHACATDADCNALLPNDELCDPRYSGGLCRPANHATPAVWRNDPRDRLAQRCGADAALPYPFILFNARLFDCEIRGGCGVDQLGRLPGIGAFDTHPHAELNAVALLAHEYGHHMLEMTERQFHASTTRWGLEGWLPGLLFDGLNDASYAVLYGDIQIWENRAWDWVGFLDIVGERFGGDPTSTSPMCGGPERDDPTDAFSCPERVAGDADGNGLIDPGETVATPTCAPIGDGRVDNRCLEIAGGGACPAAVGSGLWCAPQSGVAYRAVDTHHNAGWLLAAMARLRYAAGRKRAAGGFAGLISSGIDDLTTVSRGTNSIYQVTAEPPAGTTSPVGWYAAETWKAFSAGVHNDDHPAVNPEPLDEESNLTFHGDLMQGRERAIGAYRAMHVGQLEQWPGSVAVAGKLDRQWDRDTYTTWLEFGKDYEITLDASDLMMELAVFRDRARGPDESAPTGTTLMIVPEDHIGTWTYRALETGYHSFRVGGLPPGPSCRPHGCPYRLFISRGRDCGGDPSYDCRDDYPDARHQAVPLPQSAQQVPGTLTNEPIRDRDQFRFFLQAGLDATVRLRTAAPRDDYLATAISPAGRETPIDVFRCRAIGDCAYELDVAQPAGGRGGWWNIELERLTGSAEPVAYELSILSSGGLPCSSDIPADAAEPCLIPGDGGVAGTLLWSGDRDVLWFEGERDHVYVIAVDGDVTASLHPPTFWVASGTAPQPGTTPANRPMFRHSDAWPGQLSIVAPLDGMYGIRVAPEGSRSLWNYSVRVFESHWTDPDYPTIVQWAGPSEGCELP